MSTVRTFLFLSVVINCMLLVEAARFSATGPVLTVTLKDPVDTSSPFSATAEEPKGWGLDISSLRPSLLWSIRSLGPPLPNWFPTLKSCRTTIGYRYDDMKKAPSYIEGDALFSNEMGELNVQPTYEVKKRKTSVVLLASRGESYGLARFTNKGNQFLEFLRASYQINLPFLSVGAVRITPTYDFVSAGPSCTVEGVTSSQRTKAILKLQPRDPTLTVVHLLDDRNTIAPEISLHDAKILYQWTVSMDSGSIRTRVDPTSDIQVTWTDRSMNGRWVTDFRFPLTGTTLSALAADVKVRRQFQF